MQVVVVIPWGAISPCDTSGPPLVCPPSYPGDCRLRGPLAEQAGAESPASPPAPQHPAAGPGSEPLQKPSGKVFSPWRVNTASKWCLQVTRDGDKAAGAMLCKQEENLPVPSVTP